MTKQDKMEYEHFPKADLTSNSRIFKASTRHQRTSVLRGTDGDCARVIYFGQLDGRHTFPELANDL